MKEQEVFSMLKLRSPCRLRAMSDEVEQLFLLNNTPPQDADPSARLENCDGWCPPDSGVIKCNIHANWRNAYLHTGVAWIARDQFGNVSHHAREAIFHAPNRMVADLRCVIWLSEVRSLRDLKSTKGVHCTRLS
ncbi:hypothetical protein Bca52824_002055 [Brassica carinata]|uniref:Uncharacterized protein n=1 Tax=Brassica carinata TaxID=52824 RepID=A0A8X7WKG3_BRACI|nr:hypothetical protein Bca52824_002055 [Brassica carinata]